MVDDSDIEIEILEIICNKLKQFKWPVGLDNHTSRKDISLDVSKNLGVKNERVEYVLDRLIKEGFLKYTPTDKHLYVNIYTIDRYEELTGKDVFPLKKQLEVLGVLYNIEKEKPGVSEISRNKIHKKYFEYLGLSHDELDRTIWYLNEIGDIKINMVIDQLPPYTKIRLTNSGKSKYKNNIKT